MSAVLAAYEGDSAATVDQAAVKLRTELIELDRTELKSEIGAQRNTTIVTQFMPECWVRSCYPADYFGLERNPAWVAASRPASNHSDEAQLQLSAV